MEKNLQIQKTSPWSLISICSIIFENLFRKRTKNDILQIRSESHQKQLWNMPSRAVSVCSLTAHSAWPFDAEFPFFKGLVNMEVVSEDLMVANGKGLWHFFPVFLFIRFFDRKQVFQDWSSHLRKLVANRGKPSASLSTSKCLQILADRSTSKQKKLLVIRHLKCPDSVSSSPIVMI